MPTVADSPVSLLDFGLLDGSLITEIVEFLKKKYPWYPPCDDAVITSSQSGWGCYEGRISFVDTVTWRCSDGTTVTKQGASIVTEQKC